MPLRRLDPNQLAGRLNWHADDATQVKLATRLPVFFVAEQTRGHRIRRMPPVQIGDHADLGSLLYLSSPCQSVTKASPSLAVSVASCRCRNHSMHI